MFGGSQGYGAVFKVDKDGHESVLYSFRGGNDGSLPNGVVLDPQGDIYGVAKQGGTGCKSNGCGLIYRIDAAGNRKVLYRFTGGEDGGFPFGVVVDSSGNLYGTAAIGGNLSCNSPFGCGVVFKFDKAGKETILHTFTSSGGGMGTTLMQACRSAAVSFMARRNMEATPRAMGDMDVELSSR
jgi:uncharacterized repeat protein (TIGR03803 family)